MFVGSIPRWAIKMAQEGEEGVQNCARRGEEGGAKFAQEGGRGLDDLWPGGVQHGNFAWRIKKCAQKVWRRKFLLFSSVFVRKRPTFPQKTVISLTFSKFAAFFPGKIGEGVIKGWLGEGSTLGRRGVIRKWPQEEGVNPPSTPTNMYAQYTTMIKDQLIKSLELSLQMQIL